MTPIERIVLVISADAELTQELIGAIYGERSGTMLSRRGDYQLPIATNLDQVRLRLRRVTPLVILLDESSLGPHVASAAAVRELVETAPVVLLAGARDGELKPAATFGNQNEPLSALDELVAAGELDIVPRVGEFLSLAVALLERRVRWAEQKDTVLGRAASELPEEFAEIIRHELNNPLTGILGNAELLLARRERLPAFALPRLETIADLAVQLRETVRRLSAEWRVETRRHIPWARGMACSSNVQRVNRSTG